MFENMRIKTLLLLAGFGLAVASATASTITYVQTTGTPYQTPAITAYNTYGNDMAGMQVWVTFSDGLVKQATWQATGSESGAATVAGYFSISESGTTYNDYAWALQNLNRTLAITGFTMLGAPGDTTFDRTFGSLVGTPGSALGKDFTIAGNYTVTATYSDILNLTGFPAVGDEFVSLGVSFNPNTYFQADASTTFTQDTDNAATHGSITIVPDAGSTGMMLGLGLASLAALKRRLVRA